MSYEPIDRKKIFKLKRLAKEEMQMAQRLNTFDLTEAQEISRKLVQSSSEMIKLAEELKCKARLEDLSVYEVKMRKTVRKGERKT